MPLLADYRKKLVSENLCLAGLGQKLELVSISLAGEYYWHLFLTLCASSSTTTLPSFARPSKNNPRQMLNKAHASFSLMNGQLRSTIVRQPFSNFHMSGCANEFFVPIG